MIQDAQGAVCGDSGLSEGAEPDAMYVETRGRLRKDITEVFEWRRSLMACLTTATQQAAKAGRAARACEVELCATFEAIDAAGLAEHMTLLVGTVEEGSKEAT